MTNVLKDNNICSYVFTDSSVLVYFYVINNNNNVYTPVKAQ